MAGLTKEQNGMDYCLEPIEICLFWLNPLTIQLQTPAELRVLTRKRLPHNALTSPQNGRLSGEKSRSRTLQCSRVERHHLHGRPWPLTDQLRLSKMAVESPRGRIRCHSRYHRKGMEEESLELPVSQPNMRLTRNPELCVQGPFL